MDRNLVRRVIVDLRVSADDLHATVEDMLRPLGKRSFGRRLHREQLAEAHGNIVKAIAYLAKLASDDDERGDPSGNGGAGEH